MSDLKSAVYGLAVADAFGVPYESGKRDSFEVKEKMIGFGTYNQPKGSWSDDTSLTIATCDSIREKGEINLSDLADKFSEWLFNGEYTPDKNTFGVGKTTYMSINNYKKSKNPKLSGCDGERDNGNGSLMRIIPLAFIRCSEEDINEVSSITHAHEISKEACRIYIKIARKLLKKISLRNSIKEIIDEENISDEYLFLLKNINNLKREDVKSTGYVKTSLEAALWCLLNSNSYKETVIEAVKLGGDTDTIAAISGGIGGIVYGYENIPNEWIENLRNKALIDSCLF